MCVCLFKINEWHVLYKYIRLKTRREQNWKGGGCATTPVVSICGPWQRPLPCHLSRDSSRPECLCQVQSADAMPSDSRRRRTAARHELMHCDGRHGTALQHRPPLHGSGHHLGSPGGATVRTSVRATARPLMLSAHLASAVHMLSNLSVSQAASYLLPLLGFGLNFKVRRGKRKKTKKKNASCYYPVIKCISNIWKQHKGVME